MEQYWNETAGEEATRKFFLAQWRRSAETERQEMELQQERLEQQRKRLEQQARIQLRLQDNIRLFLETEGLYVYDPEGRISSQELYGIYKDWCLKEKIPLHTGREFFLKVRKLASHYRLVPNGHIPTEDGRRVRGFCGIRPLDKAPTIAETPAP